MKRIGTTTWIVAAAAMSFSSAAFANETYTCTHGDQKRVISVVYASDGQPLPCRVTYDKGAGADVLWSAENQAGYCEEQAAAFVEKQKGWGWACEKQEQAQTQGQPK